MGFMGFMRYETWQFLLSPSGQSLLAELGAEPLTPDTHLAIASRLRRRVDAGRAQALLEIALLRQKGTAKFNRATAMYFTRPALEQASAEVVSHYHAQRFREAGFERVADLGCGIGGDALALSAAMEVVGLDHSWLRLAMARENVRAYGHEARFFPVQADLLTLPSLPVDAFFFDPARRTSATSQSAPARRLHSIHHYQPPLNVILERWLPPVPHGGVKVGPAIDYQELPTEAAVEFVSVNGEVREGVLWWGRLRGNGRRRATLLPGGYTLEDDEADATEGVAVAPPRAYLYEPDGAVIRAHLVQTLARSLGAMLIDPQIAYLTADACHPTPFARCYTLEAAFPFQLKALRHYLRQRQVGRVTIKKRGSPLDPQWLEAQLRLSGPAQRTIFLTQAAGEPIVLVSTSA
jgi:SAM-dependent methyltransferase